MKLQWHLFRQVLLTHASSLPLSLTHISLPQIWVTILLLTLVVLQFPHRTLDTLLRHLLDLLLLLKVVQIDEVRVKLTLLIM